MAKTFASMSVRVLSLAGLTCALWCALAGTAPAQTENPPMPRVRTLFNTAREMFKRGDYESAAVWYAQAQAGQKDLTPTERQDLAAQIAQNNTALQARRDGGAQVRLADEALTKGRIQEAATLIKGLESNQFLAPEDKVAAANLNQKLRATANTQVAKSDYKSLLTSARLALTRGDYELAEAMANQADKVGTSVPSWVHPWSDSPAKVRREAQAARAKVAGPKLLPTGNDKTTNPFQTVKNSPPANDVNPPPVFPAGDNNPKVQVSQFPPPVSLLDNPKDVSPVAMPKPPESVKTNEPNFPEVTIPGNPTKPEIRPVSSGNARQLVKEGYIALEAGDLVNAQRLAVQAKQLKADFNWKEENPDRLLAEIQRRQTFKSGTPEAKAVTAEEARGLIRQGRTMLRQEKIDDAEKMCSRAASCTTARWGLFEDSPEKLRGDIAKARGKYNREESVRLMADARKLFTSGNLADAKAKAYKAQQLHGPYSLFDMGDRPDNLLKEIHRAELAKGTPPPMPADIAKLIEKHGPPILPPPQMGDPLAKNNPKSGNDLKLPPNPLPGNNSMVSASAQAAAKAKALPLLREARELESRWFLAEARAKAEEAAQFKASFGPEEDSPDLCLLSLQSKCDYRIKQLVQQAGNQAFNAPTDPNRFQKALADLTAAKKLANSFGLDTFRIDQEAMRMQQAASAVGITPIAWDGKENPAPNLSSPEAQKNRQRGLEKLDLARREINHGNYGLARKFAEEAMHPDLLVQAEASAVLRSIGAEEINQRVNNAQRNANAGFDAFQRRSFQEAASIFAAIDMQLLPPEVARRIGELMSAKEMQRPVPGNIVQAQGKDQLPGKASVGDLPLPGDDLTKQFKALEEIQFQQLRERGLTAERTAIQRMNTGDTTGAIEVLKDYLDTLHLAQIDPAQKEMLKRRADNRMQQYKTIQAQRILEKNAIAGQHNENAYQANIQKTQQEVGDLLKQCRDLYKVGKYQEALAQAKRAKEIDPDNLAADAVIQMAKVAYYQRQGDQDRDNNASGLMQGLRADIFPDNFDNTKPITYNEDILRRSLKRDKTGVISPNRSQSERQIESMLLKPISFNYKDTPLQEVISDIQKFSGINIVIDRQALQTDGISLDQLMTIGLEKIATRSALTLVLKQANLTWVIENEVLNVTTQAQSKGRLVQKVISVADLVIPVENHPLNPVNSLDSALSRHINNLSPGISAPTVNFSQEGLATGQTVSSSSSGTYNGLGSAMSNAANNTNTNSLVGPKNSSATLENALINLIMNTVQQNTWSHMGGPGTIQYFPLGHALIVNQTQEVQEDVIALLQSLRRLQDLEVSIEVKLVQVADSFFERIGVDFDLNILTPKSKFESQLLSGQFQPPGFINRFRPDNFVSGLTPAGTFTSDLSVPIRGSSFDYSLPPFGNFPGSIGADGGISLGLAFLSDIQVFMFMEAAQGNRRLNVMQAPKITVFNGQTANIAIVDQIFFLISSTPTFFGNTLAFVPQNQPFPVGMSLVVNPVVSADRRFVRMNLQPNITGISGAAVPLIPFQTVVQTPTIPGAEPVFLQMFFQQPQFSVIQLNTTVNVPDGGTVILGGLKVVAEGRSEFGAPLLGKIPYIDRLFRNVGYGREAQNLMIMVTPRIIINEEEEQIFMGTLPPIPRP